MNQGRRIDLLTICQGILILLMFTGAPGIAGGGATPRDILRMHRDGLSTQVLLEHIEVAGVDGRLTERKARIMREAGVAQDVLRKLRSMDDTDANDPVRQGQRRTDDVVPGTDHRPENNRSASSRPGRLLLQSRSEQPVWFRRDPAGRTLYLSGTERRSMPPLSSGDGMELTMEPGVWTLKTPDVSGGRKIRFTPGTTGRLTILGRNQKAVKVTWQPDHPEGNERELMLERQQLGMEQVSRALQSQREAASRTGRRSSRHDGYRGRPGVGWSYHNGFSGTGWGSPRILQYGHPSIPFYSLRHPGYSLFFWDNRHRRSHHHRRRSHGFDFRLDLNHDFEADGLRGSLRFRSGRSGHHDHFFHFD